MGIMLRQFHLINYQTCSHICLPLVSINHKMADKFPLSRRKIKGINLKRFL